MYDLSASFVLDFKRETWTLYAVGILAALARSVARVRRLGFRNLQADDYLVLVGTIWFTVLCVSLNQVLSSGGSNLMTEEDIQELTPETKASRVTGSKWVFVSAHSMLLTTYTLKACMMILYSRLTNGFKQRWLVNCVSIWVALGFVGSELSLFLSCRPLSNYWAVPTPNKQCSSYQYYEIIQGIFAISADILMLIIAIPLITTARLPTKLKVTLIFIFGLGIFVIVAAVLTKVYSLVPSLISYVYMSWYFREATVAMLVTCLPMTWSLLHDLFSALKRWTGEPKQTELPPYALGKRQRWKPRPDKQLEFVSQLYTTNTTVSSNSQNLWRSRWRNGDMDKSESDEEALYPMSIRRQVTITIDSDGEEGLERAHSQYQAAGVDWPAPPSRTRWW